MELNKLTKHLEEQAAKEKKLREESQKIIEEKQNKEQRFNEEFKEVIKNTIIPVLEKAEGILKQSGYRIDLNPPNKRAYTGKVAVQFTISKNEFEMAVDIVAQPFKQLIDVYYLSGSNLGQQKLAETHNAISDITESFLDGILVQATTVIK